MEIALTLAVIKPSWQFPVILNLWGWHIYIHQVTDIVAYTLGFRYYLFLKKKSRAPRLSAETNAWLLLGGIFGVLIGAKILAWTEAPDLYWRLRFDPSFWFGGKTIVGGLLGGWIGIEIAKKLSGVTISTGDVFVFPLIMGMSVGRIGCFLTGLEDNTCWPGDPIAVGHRLRRRSSPSPYATIRDCFPPDPGIHSKLGPATAG